MHERVPRTFYFIVSSPGGVAEAIFKVNFTLRYSNDIEEEQELREVLHFPVFGKSNESSRLLLNKMNLIFLFIISIILPMPHVLFSYS